MAGGVRRDICRGIPGGFLTSSNLCRHHASSQRAPIFPAQEFYPGDRVKVVSSVMVKAVFEDGVEDFSAQHLFGTVDETNRRPPATLVPTSGTLRSVITILSGPGADGDIDRTKGVRRR